MRNNLFPSGVGPSALADRLRVLAGRWPGSRSLAVMKRSQRPTRAVYSGILIEQELAAAGGLGQVHRDRVVVAEHPAAALQAVLAQGAGRLRLAQRDQGEG